MANSALARINAALSANVPALTENNVSCNVSRSTKKNANARHPKEMAAYPNFLDNLGVSANAAVMVIRFSFSLVLSGENYRAIRNETGLIRI